MTYGAAIYDARKAGLILCKYADPTEGERRDLTDEEAAEIANEVSWLAAKVTRETG